jgi:hypothetical protein
MRISEGPLSPASMVSHMHAARSRQLSGDIAKESSIFILPKQGGAHVERAGNLLWSESMMPTSYALIFRAASCLVLPGPQRAAPSKSKVSGSRFEVQGSRDALSSLTLGNEMAGGESLSSQECLNTTA